MSDILYNMTWDFVMEEVVIPLLVADDLLIAELQGPHIYAQEASRPVIVPSVVWDILDDELTELFNPISTQFDYFCKGVPNVITPRQQAARIEHRLRALMHHNVRRTFDWINIATLYEGSFSHDYPVPGVVHRSLRFTFEPPRRLDAGIQS